MFFILSKVLLFLIKPLIWIIVAFLAVIFLKSKKAKKVVFYLGLGLLLLFSNPLLNQFAWNAWEPEPVKFSDIQKTYDVVIVLGGYTHSLKKPRDRVHFNQAFDRLARGVELYKKGKAGKILLSSGSAQVTGEKVKSSLIVEDHLLKREIPQEDLLVEAQSRNTHENARASARKLKKMFPKGDFILVTSAFHMYRAKQCFEAENLEITTFPADFRGGEIVWELDDVLIPSAGAVKSWGVLIKEWVGICAYWLFGYL